MVERRRTISLLGPSLFLISCSASVDDGANRAPLTSGPSDMSGVRVLHLDQPRAVHHATELQDGRVLFTGGCTLPGCEGFEAGRSTEIFDPSREEFEPGPRMIAPRAGGTATLLNDGRVLLTGGYPGEGRGPTDTAELYDPEGNGFLRAGSMTTPRADQTATLLPDGRVLLAGGVGADGAPLDSTELFDPRTNEFAQGPRLSQPRTGQEAALVGQSVLLVGGTRFGRALRTTDLLQDGTWTPGPSLLTPRVKLGVAALDDRRVFVVGGASTTEGRDKLASTEILSVRTGTSRYGPELSEGEYKLEGAVTRLDDGRIAVAGGNKVNVYNPLNNELTTLEHPSMGTRSFISATALEGNRLLVAGGYDLAIAPTDQAWLISVR
jgi:hypothetical protein